MSFGRLFSRGPAQIEGSVGGLRDEYRLTEVIPSSCTPCYRIGKSVFVGDVSLSRLLIYECLQYWFGVVFASIKISSNHLSPSDQITLREVGAVEHTLCSEFGDISHVRSSFQKPLS